MIVLKAVANIQDSETHKHNIKTNQQKRDVGTDKKSEGNKTQRHRNNLNIKYEDEDIILCYIDSY